MNNRSNGNFWKSLPERNDRSPNELNDVPQLWRACTEPCHPMNLSAPILYQTEFGNINGDGDPTSFSSPVLGMQNPELDASLEPSVAFLVKIIKELGHVTYSSCQGHLIHDEFHEAYVGCLFGEINQKNFESLTLHAERAGFLVFRAWLLDTSSAQKHRTVEIYFPRAEHESLESYHQALRNSSSSLAEYILPRLRENSDLNQHSVDKAFGRG